MTADQWDSSQAIETLARKSRWTAILTALAAVALGGSFLLLTYKVQEKHAQSEALSADIARETHEKTELQIQRDQLVRQSLELNQQNASLELQIASQKATLSAATTQAKHQALGVFTQQLQAAVARSGTPSTQAAVSSAIRTAENSPTTIGAGRLVYIQYADRSVAAVTKTLQLALASHNFVVPDAELTSARNFDAGAPNEIKYFHREDYSLAKYLAQTIRPVLSKSCRSPVSVSVSSRPARSAHPDSTTQLEIWVTGCGATSRIAERETPPTPQHSQSVSRIALQAPVKPSFAMRVSVQIDCSGRVVKCTAENNPSASNPTSIVRQIQVSQNGVDKVFLTMPSEGESRALLSVPLSAAWSTVTLRVPAVDRSDSPNPQIATDSPKESKTFSVSADETIDVTVVVRPEWWSWWRAGVAHRQPRYAIRDFRVTPELR